MSDDRIDEILLRSLDKVESKCDNIKDDLSDLARRFGVHKESFEQHLDQDKKMYEELHRMNNILQDNTESLKEHMQRTANIERTQEIQNAALLKIDDRLKVFEQNMIKKEAIKEFMIESAKKWSFRLGILATVVAILTGIAKLAGLL